MEQPSTFYYNRKIRLRRTLRKIIAARGLPAFGFTRCITARNCDIMKRRIREEAGV